MSRGGLLLPVACAVILCAPPAPAAQEAETSITSFLSPPEEMKQIAGLEGVWDVALEYRTSSTAEEWTATHGLTVIKNVLDGTVQQMDYNGEIRGMKFTGIGFTTYDRDRGWQYSWVDNLAPCISLYTGEMKDGRLVFTGIDKCRKTSLYTYHVRQTTFNITQDRFEWLKEESVDGENWLLVKRAVYTRR